MRGVGGRGGGQMEREKKPERIRTVVHPNILLFCYPATSVAEC